jgi:hypothetical protein
VTTHHQQAEHGDQVPHQRFPPRRARRPVAFRGTLAPFFLASDNPIAIACFLLVTLPPCPDFPRRRVPRFRRRIALSTVRLAPGP